MRLSYAFLSLRKTKAGRGRKFRIERIADRTALPENLLAITPRNYPTVIPVFLSPFENEISRYSGELTRVITRISFFSTLLSLFSLFQADVLIDIERCAKAL